MNTSQYNNHMLTTNNKMLAQAQAFQPQQQPRILYFISRSNNTIVPLIPADELPFNIRIQDVSRTLTLDQTYGMQHVGTVPYTGLIFKLENTHTMPRPSSQPTASVHTRHISNESRRFLPPDALARQALANTTSQSGFQQSMPQRPLSAHELATDWRKPPTSNPADKTQDLIDAIVGTQSGAEAAARIGYQSKSDIPLPPSGAVPDQDKKQYCTYWLRTGECDYAQQGCLYKHSVPEWETMRELGFKRWPRWLAERNLTVRPSGEVATVGPILKPSVWLSQRKAGTSDDASSDGEGSESDTGSVKSALEHAAVAANKVATKDISSSVIDRATKGIKVRQHSTAGDLIDFAPLLPTPPSSTASPTPPTSVDSSPRSSAVTPSKSPEASPKPEHKNQNVQSINKIFIPAGESADVHVAEVKQRAAHAQEKRTGAHNKPTETPSLEKQIQTLQKSKHNGLMASKHAPAVPKATTEQYNGPRQRVPKVTSHKTAAKK